MSGRSAEDYINEGYGHLITRNPDGSYSAEILEFPGCLAIGATKQEALSNLEEVAKEWIESELEQDHQIPPPSKEQEYSGKFPLRLPRSLHGQAARWADADGTSLNQFIVAALAEKLGAARARQEVPPVQVIHTITAGSEEPFWSSVPWTPIQDTQPASRKKPFAVTS